MYSHYDPGLSLAGILFILVISALIGFTISFFIMRYATRANELLDIQKKILQELKVQNELLSGDKGNSDISSFYLNELKKLQSSDVVSKSGYVNHSNVEKMAKLYKKFMEEIETKNLSIFSARKAFQSEINRLSSELNENQRMSFLNVYKERLK
ncbi:hypothetical protein; putative exported protein [Xenorhabdus bovienii str. Jollieti]|uniref:Uncharacterized protein n=1 Tax=Xenorhabdus bovienii (strain SS-2004) TaxID=406818 RepID=D3V5X3_XENBS|nr:YebO family protein [Xenorhabdus bovienii]CBJ83052.1 hypothetical protein; putative exported protein [Xenorhabdus bovienii SS-2004]CDH29496.1 hypothetical protein; putative exported protein [Xenorhabdus bovienii str. Jollieti]